MMKQCVLKRRGFVAGSRTIGGAVALSPPLMMMTTKMMKMAGRIGSITTTATTTTTRHYAVLPGRATVEGTALFCNEKYPIHFNAVTGDSKSSTLGRVIPTRSTQWTISPVGFGGYRTGLSDRDHQFALQYAIQSGCNIIDTSSKYMDGESEVMIGTVVSGMVREGLVDRGGIVVMSKVGYIEGHALENMRMLSGEDDSEMAYPGIVQVKEESHWHCIDPQFIHDQLTESLHRLDMETLDVLLLHNPEHVCTADDTPDSFHDKIAAAFEQLEKEVDAGRIQRYGVSSNAFLVDPSSQRPHISLEKCLEIARSIRPDHHFDFIQFPLNVLEHEAHTQKKFGKDGNMSLIEFAHANNLCCIGNRPLNAVDRSAERIYRFADPAPEAEDESIFPLLKQTLESTIVMEQRFPSQDFSDRPNGDPQMPTSQSMHWGHVLMANMDHFDSLAAWEVALNHHIRPDIENAMAKLRNHPKAESFREWMGNYRYLTNQLFNHYTRFLQFKQAREANDMKKLMDKHCPDLTTSKTLPQKALRVLTSTGIDCMLVGMRRIEYVKDVMHHMQPPLDATSVDNVLREAKWDPIPIVAEGTLPES